MMLVIQGVAGNAGWSFFDCDILAKWGQTARTRQNARPGACRKAFEDAFAVLEIDRPRENRPHGRRPASLYPAP
jgi:hypothetical protein